MKLSNLKIIVLIIAALIFLVALRFALAAYVFGESNKDYQPNSFVIPTINLVNKQSEFRNISIMNGNTTKELKVEIASTYDQQLKGLMNREELDGYDGMLFEFENEQTRYFWMKDTPLKLDIIYFDAKGNFVSVSRNAEPCLDKPEFECATYPSEKPAKFVLETKAGFFKENELNSNTKLILNN